MGKFILTEENYHSVEANQKYMSASLYKEFVGSMGTCGCEAKAMAIRNGEYEEETSEAQLMGMYFDEYFTGNIGNFMAEHPELFTKKGELYSKYRGIEKAIMICEDDPYFMMYLNGEKQTIWTGEIGGMMWRGKMDIYHPGKCIVDIKYVKSITEMKWTKDFGHMNFFRYWGYDIQGAVYQELEYQKSGKKLPFIIAAASKEKVPDHVLAYGEQQTLNEAIVSVKHNMPRIKRIISGEESPVRCELCDYCRATKKLHRVIPFGELGVAF